MKILFVDQYNKIGGGQTILIQLTNIALEKGYKVSLLIPPGGEIQSYIHPEITHIPLKNLPQEQHKGAMAYLKLIISTLTFFKYRRLFKQHDLIYVNGPRCFIPVAICAMFLPVRAIYHIHLFHQGLEKKIIQCISRLKNTFRIIVNSEFVFKDFQSSFSSKKIFLLENSLSKKFTDLEFKNRFNNATRFNFAVIGRVSEEKGQEIIIYLAKEFPAHNFYIIGESDFASPEYFNALKDKSPSNVIFFGKSNNIIETLNTLNIHFSIVPSKWEEPFGLVAIESMACSCYTLVSEKGELPNIAMKTTAGTFKNLQDLIDRIKELEYQDEDILSKKCLRQFTSTKEHYNYDNFRNGFDSLIQLACD